MFLRMRRRESVSVQHRKRCSTVFAEACGFELDHKQVYCDIPRSHQRHVNGLSFWPIGVIAPTGRGEDQPHQVRSVGPQPASHCPRNVR
jgi:hypothetical protein